MNEPQLDRMPPASIEAEACVLGSMMVDKRACALAVERLKTQDFSRASHGVIFETARRMLGEGILVDSITLCEYLQSQGHMTVVGGPAYVMSLVSRLPSPANVETYARIVREKALLRNLAQVGLDIANGALAEGADGQALLSGAVSGLLGMGEAQGRGLEPLTGPIRREWERLSQVRDRKSEIVGMATPFLLLNRMTMGLQPGRVTVLGGDPGQGKTMLVCQTIISALQADPKVGVAIFTLEMVAEQYAHKLIAGWTKRDGFSLQRARGASGALTDGEWKAVWEDAEELGNLRVWLDDSLPKFEQCYARLLRLAEREVLNLIVVDYVQLLAPEGRHDSEASALAAVAREILELAKRLRLHVILVSQLRRPAWGKQQRTRPTIRDFKQSGGLEEIASHGLLLWRDPEAKDVVLLDLAKNKFGPEGVIELKWDAGSGMFSGGNRFWHSSQTGGDNVEASEETSAALIFSES